MQRNHRLQKGRSVMKSSRILANLALAAVLLPLCVSCATDRSQRRPYLIQENLDNAKRHMEKGNQEEAAQIYEAVLLAEPTNAVAKAKLDDIPKFSRNIMAPSALGKNLTRRPDAKGFWKRVVAYPINRVLDVLDIVSFSAGPQGGAYLDLHLTHAAQVAVGAGGGMEVGWSQPRNLALGSVNMTGFALGPWGAEGEGHTRIGLRGGEVCGYSVVGLSRPTEYAYQKYRDYWGIGVRAVAGVLVPEWKSIRSRLWMPCAGFSCLISCTTTLATPRR